MSVYSSIWQPGSCRDAVSLPRLKRPMTAASRLLRKRGVYRDQAAGPTKKTLTKPGAASGKKRRLNSIVLFAGNNLRNLNLALIFA